MSDLLAKNKVLLGITGSIAAYKSAEIARLFTKRGFEVRVVMTPSATEFITPLTMQSVTGHPVSVGFWEEMSPGTIGHIELADWADTILIAPATADFIAKLEAGMADTALHAICLASKAPILLAPAMNVNMYQHPKTQENISRLRERGIEIIDPEHGALACGWNGDGRLAIPWDIFRATLRRLSEGDYVGRHVLISTGPTREPIDPVRFISNRSSGKMGVALAREAYRQGARVTLVHGPIRVKVPSAIECHEVTTAQQMYEKVMHCAFESAEQDRPDVVIMAAAVADYRPKTYQQTKIKKSQGLQSIELQKNIDILQALGEKRGEARRPALVGFAVETGELDALLDEMANKMKNKGADMIVGNLAEDAFDLDTNRVWIVDKNGKREEVATTFKSRVARKILKKVKKL